MDRNSMVSQSFQNFPETRLRRRGTLTTPGVRHSIYSMWMVCFSAVGPNSPRIFARFLREPPMLPRRCPGNAQVLNRTIRRAGRGTGSDNSSNKREASEKPPRRAPGATILRTRTCRSRAIVRTSPGPTALAGISTRRALSRTWPSATSRAARPRVLATRANHSHLSSRCGSATPSLSYSRSSIDIHWKHDFKRADHLWLEPGDWHILPRRARRAQSASATRLRRKTVPCRAK